MLGDVNKLFVFKSLLTTPSNVLPLHLKQIFPPIIWIFTDGKGDVIKSRLPFKIFSTLWNKKILSNKDGPLERSLDWRPEPFFFEEKCTLIFFSCISSREETWSPLISSVCSVSWGSWNFSARARVSVPYSGLSLNPSKLCHGLQSSLVSSFSYTVSLACRFVLFTDIFQTDFWIIFFSGFLKNCIPKKFIVGYLLTYLFSWTHSWRTVTAQPTKYRFLP